VPWDDTKGGRERADDAIPGVYLNFWCFTWRSGILVIQIPSCFFHVVFDQIAPHLSSIGSPGLCLCCTHHCLAFETILCKKRLKRRSLLSQLLQANHSIFPRHTAKHMIHVRMVDNPSRTTFDAASLYASVAHSNDVQSFFVSQRKVRHLIPIASFKLHQTNPLVCVLCSIQGSQDQSIEEIVRLHLVHTQDERFHLSRRRGRST
jgi:hypothetical protein